MSNSRLTRLPRRALLAVPALVVAAATVVARPASADTSPRVIECAADLFGAS